MPKKLGRKSNHLNGNISDFRGLRADFNRFFNMHKQWIELMMANRRALEAMENMEQDPLMALLAIQQGERITKETADLMIKFSDLLKKRL